MELPFPIDISEPPLPTINLTLNDIEGVSGIIDEFLFPALILSFTGDKTLNVWQKCQWHDNLAAILMNDDVYPQRLSGRDANGQVHKNWLDKSFEIILS